MKVRTIRECFLNATLRRKGDVFEWDGVGDLPRHLEPFNPDAPVAPEPEEEPMIGGKRAKTIRTLKDAQATNNPNPKTMADIGHPRPDLDM